MRRPRLGKNSADFSDQVDEAVSKCKVRYFCHFWLLLFCIAVVSSLNCVSFSKGIFKFTAGRKLPTGFRRLKQSSKATAESVEGVGELDGQVNVIKSNVRSKKNIQEGYARADSLDKQQLKKYVKALAREAKLFRNARME